MDKPRIFLGSSGKQAKLLEALTDGLGDLAHVEPWTTVFNPGTTTIERLLELTREVDLAAFIFAEDDWTSLDSEPTAPVASPRDNVVFEAGLFGGVLGMRRTFILHARGAKLPTDLLGLTSIRYGDDADTASVIEKLRSAIQHEGRMAAVEGAWWQFSVTARSTEEASAVSILRVSRDRSGTLELAGRAWREDGTVSSRYWSEAVKERNTPSGLFYYFKGERPRDPNAPTIEGTAEIVVESPDRAAGYYSIRSSADPSVNYRTSGVYLRAEPGDLTILDGDDPAARVALIARRLEDWRAIVDS